MGRNRGFAMTMALALAAGAAAVLLVLTNVMVADVRRTGEAEISAQLQQMLMAGEAAVHERLGGDSAAVEFVMKVPGELAAKDGAIRCKIEAVSGGSARGSVVATLLGRRAGESLVYAKGAAGWELREAEMVRP